MKFENIYHRWKKKCHFTKLRKHFIRIMFGCDIPFEARIDKDVVFCHNAFGVVINPRTIVHGGGTVIQHGVTIGELDDSGAPEIGRNVFVGAKAMILGPIKVGDNVKIGAGAVVLSNIPNNCTVVGVPARIVRRN